MNRFVSAYTHPNAGLEPPPREVGNLPKTQCWSDMQVLF